MNSKELEKEAEKIIKEAVRILKISGLGKNPKDTYARAKSTLAMVDISVRMLIRQLDEAKVTQL